MNVVLFNPLSLCQYKLYIDMFFLNKTGISYHLWSGKLYSNLQANQKTLWFLAWVRAVEKFT